MMSSSAVFLISLWLIPDGPHDRAGDAEVEAAGNMVMSSSSVNCPVCSSGSTEEFARFTPEEAADWFCPAKRDGGRHERLANAIKALVGDQVANRECRQCGFQFSQPHVAGDQRFYTILHEQPGYPTNRWEYGKTIDHARSRFPNGGEALDIGAGSGAFLKRLGPGWRLSATESSAKLRSALSDRGLDVRETLHDFDGEKRFRLISMFQVIEHIADPVPMLVEIRRLLTDDGVVAVSTPHAAGQRKRMELIGSFDVPPNHVSIYTPESLGRVFAKAELKTVRTEIEPSSISNFKYSMQLRTHVLSRRGVGLAALASRIRNQKLRHGATAGAGLVALPRLLMHPRTAMISANFLTLGARAES